MGDNNTRHCRTSRRPTWKDRRANEAIRDIMSTIYSLISAYQFNRPRTLGLLDKIEQEKEPQAILGWRPGPGRAHIAWQLMHIGITEELFATERLVVGAKPAFSDLVPRFKGGSTPDDEIPQAALIRRVLTESRAH